MSKSLDRLTLLSTFVRIADAGSISAAARDLELSQPSASRQLAELESRFKAQLMRRTTHSLTLTEAGKDLLTDARRLLDDWEALEEKHLDAQKTPQGQLKVIAPIALGQLYLLDMAIQFQQQYPLISLSWHLEDRPIRFAEVGCDCWIKIG
ncbi:MAG: LysR family transcriptional regulator, partial [Cyanobacteria bacterium P01_D01_bin.56]